MGPDKLASRGRLRPPAGSLRVPPCSPGLRAQLTVPDDVVAVAAERGPAAGREALRPLHDAPGQGGHLGPGGAVGGGPSRQGLSAGRAAALAGGKLLREAVVCHPRGTAGRLHGAATVGRGRRGAVARARGRRGGVGSWAVAGPRGGAVGRRGHCQAKNSPRKAHQEFLSPAPTPARAPEQRPVTCRPIPVFVEDAVPNLQTPSAGPGSPHGLGRDVKSLEAPPEACRSRGAGPACLGPPAGPGLEPGSVALTPSALGCTLTGGGTPEVPQVRVLAEPGPSPALGTKGRLDFRVQVSRLAIIISSICTGGSISPWFDQGGGSEPFRGSLHTGAGVTQIGCLWEPLLPDMVLGGTE